jgi:hypothetical protein
MASHVETMFRAGQISPKQYAKLSAQAGTKPQPTRMAGFDEKGGKRDQGGVRDRGVKDTGRDAINKNQGAGSPIAGKPSKGGSVNASGQPGVGAIDDGKMQRPAFPPGGKAKPGRAKLARQKGRIPAQGGEYGGGGRDTQ